VNYFITGTDTGVGKTFVTALLTRAGRKAGLDTIALKPICCGSREDVHILRAAADGQIPAEEINPMFFELPTSPLVTGKTKRGPVEIEPLAPWFLAHRGQRKSLLVEGAGGWLMPLSTTRTMADVAVLFQLPVLVVVANRLGCLNHTLLTIESIRARGLECAGLIFNNLAKSTTVASKTNKETLREACDVPILFEILPGQQSVELATA